MTKLWLAKSALAVAAVLATMPTAEAQRGFRGGGFRPRILVGPAYGYGYPGYYGYGGYYGGYGFGFNAHPNAGKLKLDTKQKDAQVFIDGSYAGTAKEMKSTWLRQGTYALEVSAAMERASCSNRAECCPLRVLMATMRSSRVSRAFQTSPMPPAPRAERIRYGPSLSPGESVICLSELSLADQQTVRS
ncbi:MAG: hypothetical protein ABIR70_02865 [Bryobacteraceae bacterium]